MSTMAIEDTGFDLDVISAKFQERWHMHVNDCPDCATAWSQHKRVCPEAQQMSYLGQAMQYAQKALAGPQT